MTSGIARPSGPAVAATPAAQRDVAGEAYWSEEWRSNFETRAEDERDRSWRNHTTRHFDALFAKYVPLATRAGAAPLVTEIGCARSRWLPYFARRFGATVGGLDYSEIGCEQARIVLGANGFAGRIVQGDLFNPPAEMLGAADVVYSWGLVEHFEDTAGVMVALARFVRPGGLLITIIPNMAGAVGSVQKWMNEAVYNIHVPVDRERLAAGTAGLDGESMCCDYFTSCNFWTVNLGKGEDVRPGFFKRFAYRCLTLITMAAWLLEMALRTRLPATRLLSPYIVSVWRVAAPPAGSTVP